MIRLPRPLRAVRTLRALCKGLPIFALAMALGSIPGLSSETADPPLTPQESKVLDEYRLHCRPGRFIEEVRENLDSMRHAHPGSTFLQNPAFLAQVHYLDWGFLWNANGKKIPGGTYTETWDSIFNGYAPSREAWKRSRSYGNKAALFGGLGVFLGAANLFLGLNALMNGPPRGQPSLGVYRTAQIALPIGWIGGFIYGGWCAAREDRELDNAFFESNGKAIAKRLAEDL